MMEPTLYSGWARGVETFLTRRFYRNLGDSDYEYHIASLNNIKMGNYQTIRIDDAKGQYYTSIFWDILDTFNQNMEMFVF